MIKAVLTDVDGMLCDYIGIAWIRYLGVNNHIDDDIYDDFEDLIAAYSRGLIDYNEFTKDRILLYAESMKNKDVKEVDELAKSFFDAFKKGIPKESLKLVKYFKKQGYKIIAITVSPSPVAEYVLKYLGITEFYSTELETLNGKYTGDVASKIHQSKEGKLAIVRSVIINEGINTSESFAIGDTMHDLPLLESVAYPIALNPKGKLVKHAIENNFSVATFDDVLDVCKNIVKSGKKSIYEQVKFIYEVGNLKYVKKSWWANMQIDSNESVAEHSHRSSIVSALIALEEGEDPYKCAFSNLVRELNQVRTTNINRLMEMYIKDKSKIEKESFDDLVSRLDVKKKKLIEEAHWNYGNKKIENICFDAVILENLMTAREYEIKGHAHSRIWIEKLLSLLRTKTGKKWGKVFSEGDPSSWWFGLKKVE
jgi:putative hydrolases of HD superfamily